MATIPLDRLSDKHLLVLYLISLADDGIPTRTHYQKILFLTLKTLGIDPSDAMYKPHHYGPYSELMDLYKEELIEYGYVHELGRNDDRGRGVIVNEDVATLASSINPPSEAIGFELEEMVDFICSLKWDELLLLIYTMDAQYAEYSQKVAEINANRVPIALRMASADKISLSKGAELAGLDIRDFRELLSRRRRR